MVKAPLCLPGLQAALHMTETQVGTADWMHLTQLSYLNWATNTRVHLPIQPQCHSYCLFCVLQAAPLRTDSQENDVTQRMVYAGTIAAGFCGRKELLRQAFIGATTAWKKSQASGR